MKRYVRLQLALQVGHEVEDLGLHRHVEGRDGLVGDHQRRVERQRARDADALTLAARELVGIAVERRRVEPDGRRRVRHPLGDLASASPILLMRMGSATMSPTRAPRVERRVRILEHQLHLAPVRPQLAPRQTREFHAVELDASRGDGHQLHEAARQRRLAAPRLADDAQRLAAADLERHAVHRLVDDASAPELVARVVKFLTTSVARRRTSSLTPPLARSRATGSSTAARRSSQHASRCPPSPVQRRAARRRRPCGTAQRGAKAHPVRHVERRHRVPGIVTRRARLHVDARHRAEQPPRVGVARVADDLDLGSRSRRDAPRTSRRPGRPSRR